MKSKMVYTLHVDKYKEPHLVNIILTVPKRKLGSYRGKNTLQRPFYVSSFKKKKNRK